MSSLLHPSLPLLLGVAAMPLAGAGARRVLTLLATTIALAMVLLLPRDASIALRLLDMDLEPLRADALGRVMAVAFTLFSVMASLFGWGRTSRGAQAASLALAAAGVGVVLAGDLLSMMLAWELLAVSSMFLVWTAGPHAHGAGYRYIIFHLIGGLFLLAGVVSHLQYAGSLAIVPMDPSAPGAWLVLIGVAINAAVPPLHAWLPDAYPRATPVGTVFLSAFTTKSAVCILLRLFAGYDVLVWAGAAMALYGVIFAVLENDIRRLLSYHIVSQVGYMVCGVGMGTALSLNGTTSHAFCHIFYKGLLLMSAAAVIHATGRGKLTELGHIAKPLRLTLAFMLIGAFSISGVPLLNGFVSKSMVVTAAAEAHLPAIEFMLVCASVGTFLSIALKMAWYAFFGLAEQPPCRVQQHVPATMVAGMALASAMCIVTGLFPDLLYRYLPYRADYHPYTANHVLTALQLLAATTLVFCFFHRSLAGRATITLDVDRLYRRPLALALDLGGALVVGISSSAERAVAWLIAAARDGWLATHETTRRLPLAQKIALVALFFAGLWLLCRMA